MQESVASLSSVQGTWLVGVLAMAVSQLELDVPAGLCPCPCATAVPGAAGAKVSRVPGCRLAGHQGCQAGEGDPWAWQSSSACCWWKEEGFVFTYLFCV